uniref:Uncharacterized protein n=1 Tax=Gorilla gorilla gorilla TaxID=9595 RepID=A0A2I2YRG8_GORGO
MGSVLSTDSGKSAPASATARALERRRDPELPVTSFDCAVCLEVLHQPVRTRCGHFCPLCRLIPDENPSSFSGSLIRHLQVSHTLFYDDFIDFNIIEEALIRRVLDRSLLEYVNHSNTT